MSTNMEDIIDEQRLERATPRPYKINIGDIIKIHRQDFNSGGKQFVFYSTVVKKTEKDGTTGYYSKELSMPSGTDLKDGVKIKIMNMFEDVRKNKKDRYQPVWQLHILDYKVIDENISNSELLSNYANDLEENSSDIELDF